MLVLLLLNFSPQRPGPGTAPDAVLHFFSLLQVPGPSHADGAPAELRDPRDKPVSEDRTEAEGGGDREGLVG